MPHLRSRWRTILVPHDFSSCSNHAAAFARDEAKLHNGRLILLHVVDLLHFGPDATLVLPDKSQSPIGMREYAVRSATVHLDDLLDRLRADGVPATAAVRFGNPVDEINRFAAEQAIEIIVMGTHGRTGFRRLVAGSVAERVVRSATAPVLTVRSPED